MVAANNVQTRSNGVDDRGQPLVTTGGGPLPLPMPTQPATLTATRVATKANRTFFIGVPLSFTPTRGTLSCFAAPLVARRSQWFTGSGDVGALRKGLCLWGHSYAACAAKPAVAAYRLGEGRRATRPPRTPEPPPSDRRRSNGITRRRQ